MEGSFINRVCEGHTINNITVGTGVTEYGYSDRHAYEVTKVIDEKHLLIRRMKAIRIDKNGMSDCQDYRYESQPDYPECKLVFTRGQWRERYPNGRLSCDKFSVGRMEEYYDYSF